MSALEAALKRDRLIVFTALTVVTMLAWAYLLWLARAMASGAAMADMSGMQGMADMPGMTGMSMGAATSPRIQPWTLGEFGLTFLMWAVMMAGMMTPSAAPMILIYARVARQAAEQGRPLAAAGWFAGGYLLSWMVFSLVAAALQAALERAVGLTPAMAVASGGLGGGVLIAAGLYQWTPIKDSCLRGCRAPFAFIQEHGGFTKDGGGALRLGLRHGLYCIGCCWALMLLLFVGGVMNIAWIAAIAVFVLAEKIIPRGHVIARLAGVGFVAAGIRLII